jgi:hypothetical protein
MNYYPSNYYRSISGRQLSQSSSLLRPLVAPLFTVNRANPQTSICQGKRQIFSKRGLAAISYAISAGLSGGIWLGIFRTAQHFLK